MSRDTPMLDELKGFVGRASELELLRQCAGQVRAGRPMTVRLVGVAGIGKTSLMRTFLGELDGFTVLTATAPRSRQGEAYGTLSQLLSRHRGTSAASGTSVVSAAAELLDLLGELQADGPVAVVVDDEQWVDQFSMRALAFVERRLSADQVLLLMVSREEDAPVPYAAADAATVIRLTGLTVPEVADFVAVHAGASVARGAASWMRDRTGGHPLHLRALLAAGGESLAADATVPLDAAILTWMDRQPEPTRRLLAALAVLDTRVPLPRLGRLAGVDDPAEAVEPAVRAGVVDWWSSDPSSPVSFGHQLHRDTLYTALPAARRRELHERAATLVGRRSGWVHRVAAAAGSDESLARELELAASEEMEADEHDRAANYQLWAAELSESRAEHERRLLTGVLYSLRDFRTGWAARRNDEILDCAPSPLRDCALGVLALLRHNELTRAEELIGRVMDAELDDSLIWVRRTAATFLAALQLWRGRAEETVSASEQALADPSIDRKSADMARMTLAVGRSRERGWPAALHELRHLPAVSTDTSRSDIECLALRGALRAMDGQLRAARDDLAVVVRYHRSGTRSAFGNGSFYYLAAVQYLLGEWDDSVLTASQGVASAEADEQVFHHGLGRLAAVLVPAGRGDETTAARHVRAARANAERSGMPQDLRYHAIASAISAQARADHPAMLDALGIVRGLRPEQARVEHVWWQLWWRPLLVEALIGTNCLAEAGRELAELTSVAGDVAYLRVVVARLEGWLLERRGETTAARARYQRALDEPVGTEDPPLHRGMLEVALGGLLRANGANALAAERLRSAHQRFRELGARPFAERCAAELVRCADKPAPADVIARARLSEREYQVVRLTQRGMTNREIAAELYLSSKTVEYHLGNVFAKLGVRNRRQLRGLG
ncbi:MAG TPA: LuxR C-terminal-related transcriptional regulator [Pseudonocardia sp.]|nr:LuxR C-terminal-related transcriptional regulator [Pseudonocardia sp.]